MQRLKQILIFMTVGTMVACSGIRVNQDYEIATDFNKYRTFDIETKRFPGSGDILMDSPLVDQRVRSAIEDTLLIRGYSKTSDSSPDFHVKYQLAVKTRIEADSFPAYGWWGYPCGYRRCYNYPYWGGGFGYETYVRQYEELTLVVDFWDSNTNNRLVLQGVEAVQIAEY